MSDNPVEQAKIRQARQLARTDALARRAEKVKRGWSAEKVKSGLEELANRLTGRHEEGH